MAGNNSTLRVREFRERKKKDPAFDQAVFNRQEAARKRERRKQNSTSINAPPVSVLAMQSKQKAPIESDAPKKQSPYHAITLTPTQSKSGNSRAKADAPNQPDQDVDTPIKQGIILRDVTPPPSPLPPPHPTLPPSPLSGATPPHSESL